jgi:hypothetical protein
VTGTPELKRGASDSSSDLKASGPKGVDNAKPQLLIEGPKDVIERGGGREDPQ